jgi:hypothetical protein
MISIAHTFSFFLLPVVKPKKLPEPSSSELELPAELDLQLP